MKIHRIVVHERPHLDEILAIWLLHHFGEEKYPGAREAEIVFSQKGGEIAHGITAEDMEGTEDREGTLFIGTGGGKFDEHATEEKDAQPNECSATLVAKDLGVEDDIVLKKILKFTLRNDRNGSNQPYDLASMIKNFHSAYPDNPGQVIDWALKAINVDYQKQFKFFNVTKPEFELKAKMEVLIGPRSVEIVLVTVASDDENMNAFARSEYGVSAGIVIQKTSSGNVQIFTSKKVFSGTKMRKVVREYVRMIRLAEQEISGEVITTDWNALEKDGKVPGVDKWFFHADAQLLLNSSLTASKIPPTQIPLERIRTYVRLAIKEDFPETCEGEEKCLEKECPWYNFGLFRCRTRRYNQKILVKAS